MDKQLILNTLKKLKENSPKRNFKQSIDLIMNFRGLDLKKPEHQINMFVNLHHDTGKKISICALIEPDLADKSKEACDEIILAEEFSRFKGKADIKKLADKHDFFIAQSSIMPKVATIFGRFLGPRGKMPNPKIGSVLQPNANVKQVCEKLRTTVALVTKNEPAIKCSVGKEDISEEVIADNVLTVYNSVLQKLPNEKENIKSVMLKLTMGHVFNIREESNEKALVKKGKKSRLKIKNKVKTEAQK
ncbi:50S ribosomal protein L1 [Candidatus Woesearchaeota archaeon]|nr:50S ribosomal protein L1 [Candidatus Woesearchaeota archaeon]